MNLRKKLAFAVMALAIPSSWADIPESSVSSAAVFAVKKAWPRAASLNGSSADQENFMKLNSTSTVLNLTSKLTLKERYSWSRRK